MKVDRTKLRFLVGHWPEIQLQRENQEGWPMRYTFYHPMAFRGQADDICHIEITEHEYKTARSAWEYENE